MASDDDEMPALEEIHDGFETLDQYLRSYFEAKLNDPTLSLDDRTHIAALYALHIESYNKS